MPLNVTLVVVGGDVKTTELKLRLPSTIGRGRGTGIVLPHPLVSRQHCELFEVDGQLMVKDLGSLNGTFVNNERITESPLPPGELLTVGTVTFRAVYEGAEEATPAAGTSKRTASDKTIPATKAPTIKATPKPAKPAAESDSGVLEFNFDEPVLPGDESEAAAAHPTERLKTTEPEAEKKSNRPAASKPAEKAAARKPQKPPDDVTVASSADDEDEGSQASDDDLNDFLKSLDNG